MAFGAIAYLAREMARQYELRLQHGMLDDLCKLLAASPAASHLSDAAYCRHLLGDQIGLDATHSLRRAAAIIPTAPTLDDLEPGTVALADAVKSSGLPRFARAMQAAANAGLNAYRQNVALPADWPRCHALCAGLTVGKGHNSDAFGRYRNCMRKCLGPDASY